MSSKSLDSIPQFFSRLLFFLVIVMIFFLSPLIAQEEPKKQKLGWNFTAEISLGVISDYVQKTGLNDTISSSDTKLDKDDSYAQFNFGFEGDDRDPFSANLNVGAYFEIDEDKDGDNTYNSYPLLDVKLRLSPVFVRINKGWVLDTFRRGGSSLTVQENEIEDSFVRNDTSLTFEIGYETGNFTFAVVSQQGDDHDAAFGGESYTTSSKEAASIVRANAFNTIQILIDGALDRANSYFAASDDAFTRYTMASDRAKTEEQTLNGASVDHAADITSSDSFLEEYNTAVEGIGLLQTAQSAFTTLLYDLDIGNYYSTTHDASVSAESSWLILDSPPTALDATDTFNIMEEHIQFVLDNAFASADAAYMGASLVDGSSVEAFYTGVNAPSGYDSISSIMRYTSIKDSIKSSEFFSSSTTGLAEIIGINYVLGLNFAEIQGKYEHLTGAIADTEMASSSLNMGASSGFQTFNISTLIEAYNSPINTQTTSKNTASANQAIADASAANHLIEYNDAVRSFNTQAALYQTASADYANASYGYMPQIEEKEKLTVYQSSVNNTISFSSEKQQTSNNSALKINWSVGKASIGLIYVTGKADTVAFEGETQLLGLGSSYNLEVGTGNLNFFVNYFSSNIKTADKVTSANLVITDIASEKTNNNMDIGLDYSINKNNDISLAFASGTTGLKATNSWVGDNRPATLPVRSEYQRKNTHSVIELGYRIRLNDLQIRLGYATLTEKGESDEGQYFSTRSGDVDLAKGEESVSSKFKLALRYDF